MPLQQWTTAAMSGVWWRLGVRPVSALFHAYHQAELGHGEPRHLVSQVDGGIITLGVV